MKQFAVIHIEKRKEISAVLERHITRTEVTYEQGKRIEKEWTPNNADTERTQLNKELVDPRYNWVHKTKYIETIYELAGTWATDPQYGQKLEANLVNMENFSY